MSSAKHRHYEKTLKSSGRCDSYMANYYVIRIKFPWGFSYVTHYMNHSLLGTRRVISSIITRNLFVTRNKQTTTIGTNRMCISRDDNCAITMCFPRQLPTTVRKLFTTICFICKKWSWSDRSERESSDTCVIQVVLSVSYLVVSYFVMNFLRATVCKYRPKSSFCGRSSKFEFRSFLAHR